MKRTPATMPVHELAKSSHTPGLVPLPVWRAQCGFSRSSEDRLYQHFHFTERGRDSQGLSRANTPDVAKPGSSDIDRALLQEVDLSPASLSAPLDAFPSSLPSHSPARALSGQSKIGTRWPRALCCLSLAGSLSSFSLF